jgi:3-carboxy-cis,cis-muconate cycloisomerase
MPARLIDALSTTEPLAEVFSDTSVLQAMLDFEAALARAEARVGVIPQSAADAIVSAAVARNFDPATLARETLRAGTPGIPIAKALTERVRSTNPEAAAFVHWGATSQDVADTALVLLLKKTQPLLDADLAKTEQALASLSAQHANTVMLGRTLLQAAPPITFGLKASGWHAAIRRGRHQLSSSFAAALLLQFGGATGTLAALGDKGSAISQVLADELGLANPEAPWHTQRDRLGSLVCACGVVTGSLGKIARDISLLMQDEVGEAAEPGGQGRGGSSTMPHKRNPIGCAITLAAANRTPGLVAGFLSGMIQEHERGAGGWQAEWTTVSSLIQATGVAAASMAEVTSGLTIDPEKMRANITATRGIVFAERAMILLGKTLGRDQAHRLLEEATRKSVENSVRLTEILAAMPEITQHLDPKQIEDLDDPHQYFGSAEVFRQRQLADGPQATSSKQSTSPRPTTSTK